MFKIAIYLSLFCLVFCEEPIASKSEPRKQFRYVEEEDFPPEHYPSPQKQEYKHEREGEPKKERKEEREGDHHEYGRPKYPESHSQQKYANNEPEVYHHEYAVPAKQDEERRPLVSVNTQGNGVGGKNVDVGVNVGSIYQMDLKRENNNWGQKAVNLGLSVLNGLVKVNVQRERDPFSGKRGPILVQVGGHTVYTNQ